MHKNAYAVAAGTIPPEICDEIIRMGDTLDNMSAEVAFRDSTSSLTRVSTVAWFTEDQSEKYELDFSMMYDNIFQVISQMAYDAGWGDWEITQSQAFQYTKYGPGGHYDWHPDAHKNPENNPANPSEMGLIRKLSCVILLNDITDYDGGHFLIEDHQASGPAEFWHRIVDINMNPSYGTKGTVIVFPSHLWHKVMPIQKGIRQSLVGWFLGPPWK